MKVVLVMVKKQLPPKLFEILNNILKFYNSQEFPLKNSLSD